VQETAHDIAKSVKASNDYSLEEKEVILSNLKAINHDAKEFASAHGRKKEALKTDLHAKLAALKSEMHGDRAMEEEDAQQKVSTIHNDIKAVKEEVKAAHLKGSQKRQAKKLMNKLEEEYSELASQTTKEGRKEVARSMKSTASQLKEFMEPKESLQSKKDKIMSELKSTEQEYASKDLSASVKSQIHAAFEEMKSDLKSDSDSHHLKIALKEKIQQIRHLEEESKQAEKDDDLEEDEEDEDNDFEEEHESKGRELEEEEEVSGDEE